MIKEIIFSSSKQVESVIALINIPCKRDRLKSSGFWSVANLLASVLTSLVIIFVKSELFIGHVDLKILLLVLYERIF